MTRLRNVSGYCEELGAVCEVVGVCRLAPFLGRRMGGQGAVAFAHHKDSAATLYAIKFFFSSKAFNVERAAACNPELRALMPPVATIEDDSAELAAATAHMPTPLCDHPLPPAIVTEKGESLDEFVARSAPDRFTALQARTSANESPVSTGSRGHPPPSIVFCCNRHHATLLAPLTAHVTRVVGVEALKPENLTKV